jgi:diketogulonate reductase-like aldo/keto reductase
MEELLALPSGDQCAANQVQYHLGCRGIEWDLMPLCRERRIAVMAYSPLDEGRLLKHRQLLAIAQHERVAAATIALAWLLAQQGVAVIPKAVDAWHVHDNKNATDFALSEHLKQELDSIFPPPRGPVPLQVI